MAAPHVLREGYRLYPILTAAQVLVEGDNPKAAGQAVGRSRHNKLVFFDGDGAALAGELVTVLVERVHAYTLFGRRAAAAL
jgi:tRNA A37 methylthiotransferase MiaB